MSENKCPKCGASISENKQYCPHCGARLSLTIEAPIIIEKTAKPKQELSPKTKKRIKIAGISATAFAVTIGLLIPLVFVPSAQISEVKKGNIYSFDKICDYYGYSYSVRANPSLIKYFSEYLPSEITIPNKYKGLPVTEIGEYAFNRLPDLSDLDLEELFTNSFNISDFYCCSSLKSITIPNSVTSIGTGAFFGCSSLESITIPDSVTLIGSDAFAACSNLDKVFYTGSEDKWLSTNFGSTSADFDFNMLYFYSEEEPTISGNYWHYVGGTPTIWGN